MSSPSLLPFSRVTAATALQLVSATEVEVKTETGSQRLKASHIVLATGGTPIAAPFPGGEHTITSDGVFDITRQPRRVAVCGAGYGVSVYLSYQHKCICTLPLSLIVPFPSCLVFLSI